MLLIGTPSFSYRTLGQAFGHGHQILKPAPAQLARYGLLEHGGPVPGLKECLPEVGKRPQGTANGRPGVSDTGITDPFCLPPGPAADAVVSLHEGVRQAGPNDPICRLTEHG